MLPLLLELLRLLPIGDCCRLWLLLLLWDEGTFLWRLGLGDLECFRVRLLLTDTSSERLDCSETPLSQVSYSASDWEGDGEGQGEWS